ncbi:MAG TPA: c-type cytochrome [Chthonomonadaceae bacterium]|nr:c-type cytochrome [Chthonomonadaceae bacterium]
MRVLKSVRCPAIFAALVLPLLLVAFAGISRVGAQPPAGDELAGNSKQFKNIRVLKNVPAKQIIPIMHNWSESLGEKCEFCHVVGSDHKDFWRDDKPAKATARGMVLMALDINKHQKIIGGKATCFMCHHGHAVPQLKPEGAENERR